GGTEAARPDQIGAAEMEGAQDSAKWKPRPPVIAAVRTISGPRRPPLMRSKFSQIGSANQHIMGIAGLLPLVKPYSKTVNINMYSGCKAAVDAYCWLHKGAIACADRLFEGDDYTSITAYGTSTCYCHTTSGQYSYLMDAIFPPKQRSKNLVESELTPALIKWFARMDMADSGISPAEYIEKFNQADSTFQHQPVFDPKSRKVVPLTPVPEGRRGFDFQPMPDDISFQLALGNLNPFTLEKYDDWNPDQAQVQNQSDKTTTTKDSIWSKLGPKPTTTDTTPRCGSSSSIQFPVKRNTIGKIYRC
ncbi:unnamed protein product, partial [Nesidiocoris tenuis]